ncbi:MULTISPECIES: hypothetical protein [Actinokineospora]|uniref:Uncharacterized protein n=1 Tax=Actinokineospora fastidiosa TaxID=1816 RepID=A0A918GNV0_9PSEU|nr:MULTISPECIES: hypothetical protein [Actinokineospora]UVS78258.1 hypothetical protein Actkin_01986 [Actinokineospora sp. UTMC 2448]GGS48517.1 hypothetical protein GCM10010171_49510 [Actinokineospora fastidiosa]
MEAVPLSVPTRQTRRGCATAVVALLGVGVGAVVGLVVGLIAGSTAGLTTGLVTAAVLVAVFLLVSWAAGRRRLTLEGTTVVARTIGSKSVDLRHADRIELLVSDVRGMRTVSVLVAQGRRTINITLAVYAGTGGRELGILALRRLADAMAASEHSAGLVFSQLLVAQLRAEAKGEAAPERPLYQLAAAAPQGKLAQRLSGDAVTRFVASLD